jgi:hypothetical protein
MKKLCIISNNLPFVRWRILGDKQENKLEYMATLDTFCFFSERARLPLHISRISQGHILVM